MKTNLIINLYVDANEQRQKELEYCLFKNLLNSYVDHIYVFINAKDKDYYDSLPDYVYKFPKGKISYIIKEKRPTYNDFFDLTQSYLISDDSNINVISNTDIYLDETLSQVKTFYSNPGNKKTCIALCRWDLMPDGNITNYNHADSQDSWFFVGAVKKIDGADFTLGLRGCDNHIAYLINAEGYRVINPCIVVRSIHVHNSNIRNYDLYKESDLVKPPYLLVQPSTL